MKQLLRKFLAPFGIGGPSPSPRRASTVPSIPLLRIDPPGSHQGLSVPEGLVRVSFLDPRDSAGGPLKTSWYRQEEFIAYLQVTFDAGSANAPNGRKRGSTAVGRARRAAADGPETSPRLAIAGTASITGSQETESGMDQQAQGAPGRFLPSADSLFLDASAGDGVWSWDGLGDAGAWARFGPTPGANDRPSTHGERRGPMRSDRTRRSPTAMRPRPAEFRVAETVRTDGLAPAGPAKAQPVPFSRAKLVMRLDSAEAREAFRARARRRAARLRRVPRSSRGGERCRSKRS